MAHQHPAFADLFHRHCVTMKQHLKVALSHVARKVLQAVYGVLRYQKPFDAKTVLNLDISDPNSPKLAE